MKINRTFGGWQRKPVITYTFLTIQLLVFLLTLLNVPIGNYGNILNAGVMNAPMIVGANEWWRLFTPIFIHLSFSHIALNSLVLYFVGAQLESFLGHSRFAFIYLVSGVLGNLFSFAFGNLNSSSAGASTALFGLMMTYLVLAWLGPENQTVQLMAKQMMAFIFMNILFNLFDAQVDIFGHIGGVLGGALATACTAFVPLRGSAQRLQNKHIPILSGILLIFFAGLFFVIGTLKVLNS